MSGRERDSQADWGDLGRRVLAEALRRASAELARQRAHLPCSRSSALGTARQKLPPILHLPPAEARA